MDSHIDPDHARSIQQLFQREGFLRELEIRADTIRSLGKSRLTGGSDDEPVVCRYESCGIGVIQRPDDPQGILRISVGGGEDLPENVNYLVFRGDRESCIKLLTRALTALKVGPPVPRPAA